MTVYFLVLGDWTKTVRRGFAFTGQRFSVYDLIRSCHVGHDNGLASSCSSKVAECVVGELLAVDQDINKLLFVPPRLIRILGLETFVDEGFQSNCVIVFG